MTTGRPAGYLSTWTAAPGDLVEVHAALLADRLPAERSTVPFTVELVTLDEPGRPVERSEVRHRARTLTDAVTPTGSYASVGAWSQPGDEVSLLLWLRLESTVPGRAQTLAELTGYPDPAGAAPPTRTRWSLDGQGEIVIGAARTGIRPSLGTWYLLTLTQTARGAYLLLTDDQGGTRRARTIGSTRPGGTIARWEATVGAPTDTLNGRIEDLMILGRELGEREAARRARGEIDLAGDPEIVAAWDFARPDAAANTQPPLSIVNHPTDGLRGHDGRANAALHLSSDDLDDCGWPPVAEVRIAGRERSGVLGVRVTTAGDRLDLPLIISPARPAARPAGGRRPARALLLLPTFTYLAYANHRQRSEQAFFGDYRSVTDRPIVLDETNTYLNESERLGVSLYDRRADGTPAVYSSRLRPVLNIDPRYRWWLTGSYRHYPADLRFLRWLRRNDYPLDVTSDEHLHDHGTDLLSRYRVLITGGHPEYVSEEIHDAVTVFTRTGGRLMYLGGNGFYWVTARAADLPHRIEVRRRGDGGWWSAAEDEATLVTNGRPGGLWSLLGRPPQDLLGVGYAAQGWPRASGYRRLPASHEQEAAFVFAGVEDEVVGEFGHALQGAAGDEIDSFRADPRHPGTLRLATSAGRHPPLFLRASDAEESGAIGADLTLRRIPGGGAVFSAGSITWNASVTWNRGRNDVAAITRNVLEHFLYGP